MTEMPNPEEIAEKMGLGNKFEQQLIEQLTNSPILKGFIYLTTKTSPPIAPVVQLVTS
jgi:hypothetical protein